MEIKFIVNGKFFSTLCKTVKSADKFKIECVDRYDYKATFSVDNPTKTITFENINSMSCHRTAKIADYVKSEKSFKIFLSDFIEKICVDMIGADNFICCIDSILPYLYRILSEKNVEKEDETHIIAGDRSYHIFTTDGEEILSTLISLYENNITPDIIEVRGFRFSPIGYIDLLFEKDYYNIIDHNSAYEKGFFTIYHGYATKRLLVETGKSKIFNNWRKIAPISKSVFLDGVKWICSDPASEKQGCTRAIALTSKGVKKLFATKTNFGYTYRDTTGEDFIGDDFIRKPLTEKEKLFADENGNISLFCKIILSSKDRV